MTEKERKDFFNLAELDKDIEALKRIKNNKDGFEKQVKHIKNVRLHNQASLFDSVGVIFDIYLVSRAYAKDKKIVQEAKERASTELKAYVNERFNSEDASVQFTEEEVENSKSFFEKIKTMDEGGEFNIDTLIEEHYDEINGLRQSPNPNPINHASGAFEEMDMEEMMNNHKTPLADERSDSYNMRQRH